MKAVDKTSSVENFVKLWSVKRNTEVLGVQVKQFFFVESAGGRKCGMPGDWLVDTGAGRRIVASSDFHGNYRVRTSPNP